MDKLTEPSLFDTVKPSTGLRGDRAQRIGVLLVPGVASIRSIFHFGRGFRFVFGDRGELDFGGRGFVEERLEAAFHHDRERIRLLLALGRVDDFPER